MDDEYPIQIAPIGLKDILIPKKSENRLSALQPNLEKIKEISECYGGRGYYCETKKLNVE
ncbi:hypothetical protein [Liquorilactobacillus capillatus]|uniref:hypothetical protein n=1 Tax=Liquorilactobacillus capillatus TaxID=480931 RepID=UPI001F2BF565|nr:hypothetical protein [Liquorilactobacillus capillatus]